MLQDLSLPPLTDFGWALSDNDCYVPVMCDLPSGPEEVFSIVRCSCGPSKCAPPFKCVMNELSCSKMSSCSADIADPDEIVDCEADDADEEKELVMTLIFHTPYFQYFFLYLTI